MRKNPGIAALLACVALSACSSSGTVPQRTTPASNQAVESTESAAALSPGFTPAVPAKLRAVLALPLSGRAQASMLSSTGPRYSQTKIPQLGGFTDMTISGINNQSLVTGQANDGNTTPSHCFTFQNGTLADISPSATSCQPGNANISGVVVGQACTVDCHPFVYNGTLKSVGPKNYRLVWINDNGLAVGNDANVNQAWYYDVPTATFKRFGPATSAGNILTFAGEVNDQAFMTLTQEDGAGNQFARPFRVLANSAFPHGYPDSNSAQDCGVTPLGPNEANRVVTDAVSGSQCFPVLYNVATFKTTILPTLPAFPTDSYIPLALADNNLVVGIARAPTSLDAFWLYSPATGMTDITAMLPKPLNNCFPVQINTLGQIGCTTFHINPDTTNAYIFNPPGFPNR